MQLGVAFNNFKIDLGIFAFRALLDDFRKRVVHRCFKNFFPHETPQSVWLVGNMHNYVRMFCPALHLGSEIRTCTKTRDVFTA